MERTSHKELNGKLQDAQKSVQDNRIILVEPEVVGEHYAFLKTFLFEMLLVHPDRAPSQLHRGPRSDEPLLFQDKMARLMRLAMVRRTMSSSVKQATTLGLDEPAAQHETF